MAQSGRSTRTMAFLAATSVAAALVVGIWFALGDSADQCGGAQVAGGDIGGPFTLTTADGSRVTPEDVFTLPSVLYFGYSFCPDVCPFDNVRNAEAIALVREAGGEAQLVLVTIDPERDSPEVMQNFASAFDETAIGLSGSQEDIEAAAKAYRVYYNRQPGDDEFYIMDHSTLTYLVDQNGTVVDFFRRDETPEQMSRRILCRQGK